MPRRFAGFALLVCSGLLFTALVAESGEKEDKRARKREREKEKRRVMMGDGVGVAVDNSDELKLTPQQKAFLKQLQQQLEKERAQEKEEVEIKKLQDEIKVAKRAKKKDEVEALREKLLPMMEKQSLKWEERSNAELAKILPKEMQAKLKEIRGEPEKLPENPFGE